MNVGVHLRTNVDMLRLALRHLERNTMANNRFLVIVGKSNQVLPGTSVRSCYKVITKHSRSVNNWDVSYLVKTNGTLQTGFSYRPAAKELNNRTCPVTVEP